MQCCAGVALLLRAKRRAVATNSFHRDRVGAIGMGGSRMLGVSFAHAEPEVRLVHQYDEHQDVKHTHEADGSVNEANKRLRSNARAGGLDVQPSNNNKGAAGKQPQDANRATPRPAWHHEYKHKRQDRDDTERDASLERGVGAQERAHAC
jgi:hypothetical protein